MRDHLVGLDYRVGVKRTRRLLRKMGIEAIYCKPNLSKLGKAKYIKPYLLRDLTIKCANHVWAIDISYIPMSKGHLYLTAIIDVYSRYIVGWGLHNTLEAENCKEVLERAIAEHGEPEIINSDQGNQFTSKVWEECFVGREIKVSMDGKGRDIDNIFIERFWRTIKYEYIYMRSFESGTELHKGIREWICYYNEHRFHQSLGERTTPRMRFRALISESSIKALAS